MIYLTIEEYDTITDFEKIMESIDNVYNKFVSAFDFGDKSWAIKSVLEDYAIFVGQLIMFC